MAEEKDKEIYVTENVCSFFHICTYYTVGCHEKDKRTRMIGFSFHQALIKVKKSILIRWWINMYTT